MMTYLVIAAGVALVIFAVIWATRTGGKHRGRRHLDPTDVYRELSPPAPAEPESAVVKRKKSKPTKKKSSARKRR